MTTLFHERRRRLSFSMADLSLMHAAMSTAWQFKVLHTVELMDKLQAAIAEEADPKYRATVDAYRAAVEPQDGKIELDDDAEVSMGEDPGAYVMVWKWVPAEDAGVCRSCHAVYSDGGDGFDGECSDCADKTADEEEARCEDCGNNLNDGSDICDQCGRSFYDAAALPGQKAMAAFIEARATLLTVKQRLEMNNLAGEEDPFIEDCDNAIALLEEEVANGSS